MNENELFAICPLDGRYKSRIGILEETFSEAALITYRVKVEILWFRRLCLESVGNLTAPDEKLEEQLDSWISEFSVDDVKEIKSIERETNHDVKAVEYFLKRKARESGNAFLKNHVEMFHFGCTSEDINNLAYAGMLRDARKKILVPTLNSLMDILKQLILSSASLPMMSRTHGQPASPTTLGKELANYRRRMRGSRDHFVDVQILGKLNGAVGNFNAHVVADSEKNWLDISRSFVEEDLGLIVNEMTTQIEPHDWIARYSNELVVINSIMIDFCRDIWSYISLGYFTQKKEKNEVGSSTMPHKVNPIDFENAEGNLGLSSSLLQHFSTKLLVSRYQRDLSDSTVMRNIGVAVGYTLLALDSTIRGLKKIVPNKVKISDDLTDTWEVLAEPIQMVMRKNGIADAYERLKEISRGESLGKDQIYIFISDLDIPEEDKEALLSLLPSSYVGLAEELAIKEAEKD